MLTIEPRLRTVKGAKFLKELREVMKKDVSNKFKNKKMEIAA
jgi:hypothetical protein